MRGPSPDDTAAPSHADAAGDRQAKGKVAALTGYGDQSPVRDAIGRAWKAFDVRYLGFALLVPVVEVFRRTSFSLPAALGEMAAPQTLVWMLVLGAVVASVALVCASLRGARLGLRVKALLAAGGTVLAFLSMALALAQVVPTPASAAVALASYAVLGATGVLLFLGWAEAYARDGSPLVALYVSVSIFAGNLLQGPLIATENPWVLGAVLGACSLGSPGVLALLARGRAQRVVSEDRASTEPEGDAAASPDEARTERETERRSFVPVVKASATTAAVGFALCFYPWGVMAVPPTTYAQDHSAFVYFAGNLVGVAVMALFVYSLRGAPDFGAARQRAFFVLPAFAVFLAYFSFIRMLGLDQGGTLKTLLSIGFNASLSGFWSLFVTLAAMRQHERGIPVEHVVAPVLLLAALSYALGIVLHELYGNNAMYFLIVLATLYILCLSVISARKASLNDDARIEQNCAALAARHGLSARESEILLLIAQDYSAERIAEQLCISISTVRTHKKRIYAKLDVHKHEDLMRAIRAPQGRVGSN